jgi:hypothetical protein
VYLLSDFIVGESIDLVASRSTLRCFFAIATPLLRHCLVVVTSAAPFFYAAVAFFRIDIHVFFVAAGSVRNAFSPVLWASEPSAADSLVQMDVSVGPAPFLRHFCVISHCC